MSWGWDVPTGGMVKANSYRDSVELMLLSSRLGELPGVRQATAMMGTPANKEIMAASRLLPSSVEGARPNDLCVVIEGDDDQAVQRALAEAERLLERSGSQASVAGLVAGPPRPRSLESALRLRPDANLALISVPGEYAGYEALRAVRAGLNVFLFSDNVPLEQEVELKTLAEERGLLVMGPDCGTAIIGGVPLGFANAIRQGDIGLVGSSGTGLQEVSSLIDRLGAGISHAIGTGSRDLWEEVGGRTFLAALDVLGRDDRTRVLVLIAKPGAPTVQARVYERVRRIGKPAVICFLGEAERPPSEIAVAADLEHVARCAVALARGEPLPPAGRAQEAAEPIARALARKVGPRQRWVRGLYAGGTLGQEAADSIRRSLGVRGSRGDTPGELLRIEGHSILDLGDDAYTRGRPHPLIDARARNEVLARQARSGEVALFVLDIILGYAAHPDPAGGLRPALEEARELLSAAGGHLNVLASITGTATDPQGYDTQRRALEEIGVVVADSSSVAACAAGRVAALLGRRPVADGL